MHRAAGWRKLAGTWGNCCIFGSISHFERVKCHLFAIRNVVLSYRQYEGAKARGIIYGNIWTLSILVFTALFQYLGLFRQGYFFTVNLLQNIFILKSGHKGHLNS